MDTNITLEKIFEQLSKITESTSIIERALYSLEEMTKNAPVIGNEAYSPGDIAGQARAQAVASICNDRETTNQQLLHFYEKMYDDMMYMQGLRRENTPVVVKPIIDERASLPPVPPVPDLPELPDIPMVPPV